MAVDKVIGYEDLATGLAETMRQLGLPYNGGLPNAKGGLNRSRTKDRHRYRSMYNDEDRDVVARRFAKEIAECGYEF